MKNFSFIIIFGITLFLFNSCKKYHRDVQDYYPKVRTSGASLAADGSVIVSAELTSEGDKPVLYAGFCMDTVPNPSHIMNQEFAGDVSGQSSFTCTYRSLDKNHRYYFRAFAANEYGYTFSDVVVSIDSVKSAAPTIPCDLPLDTFIINNTINTKKEKYYRKDPISQSGTEHQVRVFTNNHDIWLTFKSKPVSGTYNVVETLNYNTDVTLLIDNLVMSHGPKVYVTEIDNNIIEITICEVSYYDGISIKVNTKFRVSY